MPKETVTVGMEETRKRGREWKKRTGNGNGNATARHQNRWGRSLLEAKVNNGLYCFRRPTGVKQTWLIIPFMTRRWMKHTLKGMR
jgi:hypothetical protein